MAAALAAPPQYGATGRSGDGAEAVLGRESPSAISPGGRRAILLSCLLAILVVSEGYDLGVLNGCVVLIKEDLSLSMMQASMVVAISPLAVIPGAMVGGHLADSLGRIKSLLVSCGVLFVGPLGMALSASLWGLVFFRAFVGAGIGSALVVVSMYIAEVAPPELRGRLIAGEEVGITIGVLLGYIANSALLGVDNDWRWMLGLGSALPLIVGVFLALPQMPESPRWLFQAGREAEAEKTLCMFLPHDEAQGVMESMRQQRRELWDSRSPTVKVKEDEMVGFGAWGQVAEDMKADPKVGRMLAAATVVVVAHVACGFAALMFYSSVVLKASMSTKEAFHVTLIMGMSKVVFVGIALVVLESVGRRSILLVSCAMVTAANAFLTFAFVAGLGKWALAIGLVAFAAGHALGLGPVTFVYLTEVFGTEYRGKGMAVAMSISRAFAVAITFTFPLLIEAIGAGATFAGQTVICLLLSITVFAFAYETGNRPLEATAKPIMD